MLQLESKLTADSRMEAEEASDGGGGGGGGGGDSPLVNEEVGNVAGGEHCKPTADSRMEAEGPAVVDFGNQRWNLRLPPLTIMR